MPKTYMKNEQGKIAEIEQPKPEDLKDLQRYGREFSQLVQQGFEECEKPGDAPLPKVRLKP